MSNKNIALLSIEEALDYVRSAATHAEQRLDTMLRHGVQPLSLEQEQWRKRLIADTLAAMEEVHAS